MNIRNGQQKKTIIEYGYRNWKEAETIFDNNEYTENVFHEEINRVADRSGLSFVSPVIKKDTYRAIEVGVQADNAVAYILGMREKQLVSSKTAQEGLYWSNIAIGKRNSDVSDFGKEAIEFSSFRNRVDNVANHTIGHAESEFCKVGNKSNTRVLYNVEGEYYLIGPFTIQYTRGYYKRENGKRIDFGGIKSASISVNGNSKTISYNPNIWEFYYPYARNYRNNSGQPDTNEDGIEYQYPHENEQFYIKLNYGKYKDTQEINEINNIKFNMYEKKARAKYNIIQGKYNLIQWEFADDQRDGHNGRAIYFGNGSKGRDMPKSEQVWIGNHTEDVLDAGGNKIGEKIVEDYETRYYNLYEYTFFMRIKNVYKDVRTQTMLDPSPYWGDGAYADNPEHNIKLETIYHELVIDDFNSIDNTDDSTTKTPEDVDDGEDFNPDSEDGEEEYSNEDEPYENNPNKPEENQEPNSPSEKALKLTMTFSGNVWRDGFTYKANGIKDSSEKNIGGIKVTLVEMKTNGKEEATPKNIIKTTYTDSNGNYVFDNIPPGLYNVVFTYDGLKDTATKFLAGGTYYTNWNEHYNLAGYNINTNKTNSKVAEVESKRDKFNKQFDEIINVGGTTKTYSGRVQKLKNIDEYYDNTETQKSVFQIYDKTNGELYWPIEAESYAKSILYPISTDYKVGEVHTIKIRDMSDINFGIATRPKVDGNLAMDVYQSKFIIKGITQEYLYSNKQIRSKLDIGKDTGKKYTANTNNSSYTQELNRADYNWNWQSYYDRLGDAFRDLWLTQQEREDNILNKNKLEELSKANSELRGYVEDIIIIRNSGIHSRLQITELANYYSRGGLIYKDDYGNDYEYSSWAYIKPDNVTEGSKETYEKIPITWQENSKYGGYEEVNGTGYNKQCTSSLDNPQYAIKKGEYIELHIVYELPKENSKLILGDKKAFVEIKGYRGLSLSRETRGYMDFDSKPGNMIPDSVNTYEDDEDKAPTFKLALEGDSIFGENNEDGIKTLDDGDGNIGNIIMDGDNIRNTDSSKDEEPYHGYRGNAIEGNAWEDLREGVYEKYLYKLSNNQVVSNGIREVDEPLINNITTILLETLKSPYRSDTLQIDVATTRTRKGVSLVNNKVLDGSYGFYNLPTGNYHVQMKYGEEYQLTQELKDGKVKHYNGQEYHSVSAEGRRKKAIDSGEEPKNDFSKVEIMLNLDISGSMQGSPIEKINMISDKLLTKLKEELPNVQLGVSNFNNDVVGSLVSNKLSLEEIKGNKLSQTGSEYTYLGKGLRENAKIGYRFTNNDDDEIKRILISLTDSYPEGPVTEYDATIDGSIAALEKIADDSQKPIYPITVITSNKTDVFGEEGKPRRGQVYYLKGDIDSQVDEIVRYILELVKQEAIKTHETGTIEDVEGDLSEKGTRHWIEGLLLGKIQSPTNNISEILNMKLVKEKYNIDKKANGDPGPIGKEAIQDYVDYSWMKAESKEMNIVSNVKAKANIKERNLGLEQRPKTELTVESNIDSVKIILSNGKTLIDTENGINKNVQWNPEKEDMPLYISMDEEIMQGAQLKIKYKITISNTGDIDSWLNYYTNPALGGATITTSAGTVYDWVDSTLVFRPEDQESPIWTEVPKELDSSGNLVYDVSSGMLTQNVYDYAVDYSKMNKTLIQTHKLNKELYPPNSPEALNGAPSSVSAYLVLSKIISPDDDDKDGGRTKI